MIARRTALLSTIVLLGGCSQADPSDPADTDSPSYAYDGQCNIASGRPGDNLCLGKPSADEGFQLHYGPSSYGDAAVAPFLLAPGEELTDCLYLTTPNDEEKFTHEYHLRARSGTHHVIVYAGSTGAPDGTLGACEIGTDMRFFAGAQSGLDERGVVLDIPLPGGSPAPENEGYAQRLGANTRIAFQMHYVNTTDRPILREAWVNFHYKPSSEVKVVMDPIFFIGGLGMNIQPDSHEVVEARGCQVPPSGSEALRVMGLSGHMHAHGVRFSAWKVAIDGSRTLVYDTYDWEEPLNAQFDSTHEYAAPNPDLQTEGAHTGLLTLARGESLDWECEVDNSLTTPLRFGNKAYTGEMCNLFGWYAPSLGGPWSCFRQ